MTDILTQIGQDREVSMTFKAGGVIPFGTAVSISDAGTVIVSAAGDSIGWAVPDDVVEATNDAEQYAANDLVTVKLKGELMQVTSGAAIAVGDFTKNTTAGKYIAEAVPTTKTVLTEGIAVTAAGGADALFEMVRL